VDKVAELDGVVEEAGRLEVEVVVLRVCLLALVQGDHLRHLTQHLATMEQNTAIHPGTGWEGGVRQGEGDWRKDVFGARRASNPPGWRG